jgi:hypothetical protein
VPLVCRSREGARACLLYLRGSPTKPRLHRSQYVGNHPHCIPTPLLTLHGTTHVAVSYPLRLQSRCDSRVPYARPHSARELFSVLLPLPTASLDPGASQELPGPCATERGAECASGRRQRCRRRAQLHVAPRPYRHAVRVDGVVVPAPPARTHGVPPRGPPDPARPTHCQLPHRQPRPPPRSAQGYGGQGVC